jgi:hypothetical protein
MASGVRILEQRSWGITFLAGKLLGEKLARDCQVTVYFSVTAKARSMTNEQLAAMHRLLAEYHRKLATEAVLDVVQQYHSDLAQRLADEAALIPRRTAILKRLHEREQGLEDGEGGE